MLICSAFVLLSGVALLQPAQPAQPSDRPAALTAGLEAISADQVREALTIGAEAIVGMESGDPNAKDLPADAPRGEWPYEGVYRVRGQIPVGYRVGGTAISALALVAAPGYAEDEARRAAVARATAFVCAAIEHPLMSVKNYDAGYDVRGWGYTYGAHFLLDLQKRGLVGEDDKAKVEAALAFYLDGIEQTQIPAVGGWNYARPNGRDQPAGPSSFMTAATVQTLLLAKAAGREVKADTLERALIVLEKSRYPSGSVAYSGAAQRGGRGDSTPGATGRMCIVEATLLMAGRGDAKDVRGALDAFFTHWDWLEARRQKTGTHVPPFGVAPYYFMFAHRYAAQCVELLPASEREEYRRRFLLTLWRSREADGTWNDRVFRRSAAYGTAMAMLGMTEGADRAAK